MDLQFQFTRSSRQRDILLHAMLKLCESCLVSAIGGFYFWFGDNKLLRSPDVYGFEFINDKGIEDKYELNIGDDAKKDKLAGLYVEKTENAKNQIENYLFGPYGRIKASYYTEPGLKGIRESIKYLNEHDINQFEFAIGVIWDFGAKSRRTEDEIFKFIDFDRDQISGLHDSSSCWMHIRDFIESDLRFYNQPPYINHLNEIHKIVEEASLGKYKPLYAKEFFNMLTHGVINRKDGRFYCINESQFQKAVNKYEKSITERSQKKALRHLERIGHYFPDHVNKDLKKTFEQSDDNNKH